MLAGSPAASDSNVQVLGGGDPANTKLTADMAQRITSASRSAQDRIKALAGLQSYGGGYEGMGRPASTAINTGNEAIKLASDMRQGDTSTLGTAQAVQPVQYVQGSNIASTLANAVGERRRQRLGRISVCGVIPEDKLMPDLSVEELHKRLKYDPETGELRWRKRGLVAGYLKMSGYRELEWWTKGDGKRKGGRSQYVLAHRAAWALVTGAWPPNEIDHRNGNRDDNRLVNLRLATSAENKQNRAPIRGKPWTMVGASKVPRCKNRWRAGMSGNTYLGTFGSPEEAHQAYLAAKAERHKFQPVPREG